MATPKPTPSPSGSKSKSLVTSGPPTSGTTTRRKTIGGVEPFGLPGRQPIVPRYLEGSEFFPAAYSFEDQVRLQNRLVAAGIVDEGEVTFGIWDRTSRTAYTKLLEVANSMGLTDTQTLDVWEKLSGDQKKGGKGGGGRAGATRAQIQDGAAGLKQRADDYWVRVAPANLNQWASRILVGTASVEEFENEMRTRAKTTFPSIATYIDGGMTVSGFAQDYLERASELLERPMESFDTNDPRWRAALDFVDPETGQRRFLSTPEWETKIRTDEQYGWRYTRGANKEAVRVGLAIARRFGAEA